MIEYYEIGGLVFFALFFYLIFNDIEKKFSDAGKRRRFLWVIYSISASLAIINFIRVFFWNMSNSSIMFYSSYILFVFAIIYSFHNLPKWRISNSTIRSSIIIRYLLLTLLLAIITGLLSTFSWVFAVISMILGLITIVLILIYLMNLYEEWKIKYMKTPDIGKTG